MKSLLPVLAVIHLLGWIGEGKSLDSKHLKLVKIPLKRSKNVIPPPVRPNRTVMDTEQADRVVAAGVFEMKLDDRKHQRFQDYRNTEYIGSVYVGNPPQLFSVVLDTGSADFWVPNSECVERCHSFCRVPVLGLFFCAGPCRVKEGKKMPETASTCTGKKAFNQTESTTFEDGEGYFVVQYGTGSARGKLGYDDVWLGDPDSPDMSLQIKRVGFGRATSMAAFFQGTEIDGILGLGFPSYSVSKMDPPFVKAYKEELVAPVFTVWMKMTEVFGADGGQITYGGVDEDHCVLGTSDRIDVKLSQIGYWQFTVIGVKLRAGNGTPIKVSVDKFEAISDTGTSYAIIPNEAFEDLAQITFGTVLNNGKSLIVDCNAQFEVIFTVVDTNNKEREIVMTHEHLVLPSKNDKMCTVAVSTKDNDPVAVIGTPLMRAYCNIHNMEEKIISFTPIKSTA